jgi:hypothetical protein
MHLDLVSAAAGMKVLGSGRVDSLTCAIPADINFFLENTVAVLRQILVHNIEKYSVGLRIKSALCSQLQPTPAVDWPQRGSKPPSSGLAVSQAW